MLETICDTLVEAYKRNWSAGDDWFYSIEEKNE
jgi:hypothetical protein